MRKFALIVVLGLALTGPSMASADTLTLTGLGRGEGVTILTGSGVTESGWAGEIGWLDGSQSIFTFCVDLFDNALSTQQMTVKTTNDLNSSTDQYTISGAGGRAAWLFNTYANTSLTNSMAAGLQLAIWETMYDPYVKGVAGTFTIVSASSDALKYAADYLGSVGSHSSVATYLDATGGGQDQIVNHVPEPASMFLTGAGMILAGILRRRRKTSQQQSEVSA